MPGTILQVKCAAGQAVKRGDVLFILEGSIVSELKDGSKRELTPGKGYVASDDPQNPHRSYSENGAKMFIVD